MGVNLPLDGGVAMDVFINDKHTCVSTAQYGDKSQEMGHSHGDSGDSGSAVSTVKTISFMTDCRGPFPVKKGDNLTLRAVYDLSKHPL
jgi:hypothetical protein